MSRPVRIYSYCIGAAFCLALGFSPLHGVTSTAALFKLAPLLALAIAGEELVVHQRQRSGSPVLSFSAPAHIAAAIVLGPVPAACIAALGVLIVDGLRYGGRRYLLLNASMFGLSTLVAGIVYELAGGTHHQLGAATLPSLTALIVTRYLMTSLILAGGTVLVTARSLAFVLGETVWEEAEATVGEASLGVLIAFGFLPGHWIVFLLLAPLLGTLYRSKSIFQRLKEETQEVLDAVATVIDERHPTTAEHTERVADYVRRFVEAIGLPEREADRLVLAARFHDIGKIAVDASTLSKEERLSDQEVAAIKRHPRLSARLLSPFHFAREIARYVELHHERYDGGGYYSIRGPEIPIEAHVLIVADSFDAMTSPRPYRPALPVSEAVQELHDKSGTQFHPLVARVFAAMVSGERVDAALREDELPSLRSAFARCQRLRLPDRQLLLDPRGATICLVILSLLLVGLRKESPWLAASVGMASIASAMVWFAKTAALRRRRRLALATINAGGAASVALTASGIATWFAWLELDEEHATYRMTSGSANVPPGDLSETCGWAYRRGAAVRARLSSGRHLLVSAAAEGRSRLAIALERQPSQLDEELLEAICTRGGASESERPLLRIVRDTPIKQEVRVRAVLLIELSAYDDVRRTAGQLLAYRVMLEVENCLREMLRETDDILRLGDDRFAVSLLVREDDVDAIAQRIAEMIAEIELPPRAAPLVPRIWTAVDGDIVGKPDLAAVAERLSLDSRAARAGGR